MTARAIFIKLGPNRLPYRPRLSPVLKIGKKREHYSGREPGEERGESKKRIQEEEKQEEKAKTRRVYGGKQIEKISFIIILL